jgi:hypothetical protein
MKKLKRPLAAGSGDLSGGAVKPQAHVPGFFAASSIRRSISSNLFSSAALSAA